MNRILRMTHGLAAVALAMSAQTLAPATRAAVAFEPPPPVETPAPDDGSPAAPEGGPFALPPSCGSLTQSFSSVSPQAIPDATDPLNPGVITATLNVVGAASTIWELAVNVDITHTYNADLDLFLISPAGTIVTLSTDNGGALDNGFHGTKFSDKAGELSPPGPVTLAAFPANGPVANLVPEEAMAAFAGENPNGQWQLVVRDDDQFATGRLLSWSLNITTLTTAPAVLLDGNGDEGFGAIADDGTPQVLSIGLPDLQASLGGLSLTTYISHTSASDLEIELLPPSGYTITVASRRGGSLANLFNGTVWHDKGGAANPPGPVTDNVVVSGTVETPLVVEEALGAAYGTNPGGSWDLVVRDMVPNGKVGSLFAAVLIASYYTCRPDLSADISRPSPARLNMPIPIHFDVDSVGLAATSVKMTATLPSTLAFASANVGGWTCSLPPAGTLGAVITCQRAGMAASTAERLTVIGAAGPVPQELGDATLTVSTANEIHLSDNNASEDVRTAAVSANLNPWDVNDDLSSDSPTDSGAMEDGGQDAFDGWGALRLRILNQDGAFLHESAPTEDYTLVFGPGQRWRTTTPRDQIYIVSSRSLYAPAGTNWLRYIDTFTNTAGLTRTVYVSWGGDLGSDGNTLTKATSSGDALLSGSDTWAVTVQGSGPSVADPPLGYALRSPLDNTYLGPGIFDQSPFINLWPSSGEEALGHVYELVLPSGASVSLAYFIYRGLGEGTLGPQSCSFYGDCILPPAGTQQALVQSAITALAAHPDFCDLTAAEVAKIINWPDAVMSCGVNIPFVVR